MSSPINLYYIRAAIEANTGVRLSLKETRQYLVEEGLITPQQAEKDATEFRGYAEFYWSDDLSSQPMNEDPFEVREDIELAIRLMENDR